MKRLPHPILEACFVVAAMTGLSLPIHAATCGEFFFDPVTISATGVAFGTYVSTAGQPATANGTITASCTWRFDHLPSFTVSLSAGSAPNYNLRHMMSGSAALDYNLYTSPAHTSVWGDGSGGSITQSNSAHGNQQSASFTIYGEIPARQRTAAGNYTDTIIVTISY
jgi:spore coat protein U domain-containing protein, fimbrial subunit CupE1/2/3/6